MPFGIERRSRNIGVQTCANGTGMGEESKGCSPKKVPFGEKEGEVVQCMLAKEVQSRCLLVTYLFSFNPTT